MASCGSQCPYHWHDNECEYCGARGDEVIDLKYYSYDTCPYYQEYLRERNAAKQAAPKTGGSGSAEGNSGCGLLLWIIIIAAVFTVCTRSCGKETRPVSSGDTQQTEAPAEETPEPEPVLQDSGFIFPDSDTLVIDQGEIEALSDSELTYAINEIYARHGYIFKSAELRGYYEQFSWYSGEVSSDEFSVDCFNQIEQQNWTLLVGERDRRKAAD